MAANCVMRSVTLAPGESYVLPSGAQVMFTSNDTLLTSQNECLVIPQTSLSCYVLPFSTAFRGMLRSPGNTDISNLADMKAIGLEVNNEFYPFSRQYDILEEMLAVQTFDASFNVRAAQDSIFKKLYSEIFGFVQFFDVKFAGSTLTGGYSNTYFGSQFGDNTGNRTLFYHLKIPDEIGSTLKLVVNAQIRNRKNPETYGWGANSATNTKMSFPAYPAADFDFRDTGITLEACS